MWRRISLNNLQAQFALTFLTIAAGIVVIILYLNQSIHQQLIEDADSALLLNASVIAHQIDELNRRNIQTLQTAARLPIFIEYLTTEDNELDQEEQRQLTLDTLKSLQIYPWNQFAGLSHALLDTSGQNVIDTTPADIGRTENRDYFNGAIIRGLPYISPLYYERNRGIYLYYSVPVRWFQDPVVTVGVLRARIAVSTIQDLILQNSLALENPAHIMLLDEHLVRVADNQHDELLFRSIDTFKEEQIIELQSQQQLPPLPNDLLSSPLPELAELIQGSPKNNVFKVRTSSTSIDDEQVALVKLETMPWYVVVSHPLEYHLAPIRKQNQGIFILVVTLLGGIIILSLFLGRRIIAPIQELTIIATKVSGGNLEVQAEIHSSDEIGVLSTTFNEMITELKQIRGNLEDRVKQRTQELSKTNKALQQEIIERKKYEERVIELALEHERSRLLSGFVQDVSHEFRTPLSIINIKVHLLSRHKYAEQTEHLNTIIEQSDNITRLVDEMVLMIHLDSGEIAPPQVIDVSHMLQTIHQTLRYQAEPILPIPMLELHDQSIHVDADPELLAIAFNHLIENAQRFTPEGQEIIISSTLSNQDVTITIKDTGIGIPDGSLERVFERFYRVDEARTMRGFGLGLPIAKQIIENYGGQIHIKSTQEQGTQVTVTFPTVEVEPTVLPTILEERNNTP